MKLKEQERKTVNSVRFWRNCGGCNRWRVISRTIIRDDRSECRKLYRSAGRKVKPFPVCWFYFLCEEKKRLYMYVLVCECVHGMTLKRMHR